MPKLPRTSGKRTIKVLEHLGFVQVRRRGSHVVLRRDAFGCVVPLHRELAVGTLRAILKQARIEPDEFVEQFKKI